MTFAEKNLCLKNKKLNKTRISSLTLCSEDFFPEFHYPDEIVTENEGNVEVFLSATSAEANINSCQFQVFNALCLSEAI